MFISPAYAQAGGGGGGDMLVQLLPLVLIFAVFWFFLIRPQQKRAKEHREMVANVQRGDQIVTAGGLMGRVTKVIDDNTVQVEIAENVRVRVVRGTLSNVTSRGEPAKAKKAEASSANDDEGKKKPLFPFGQKK